MKKILSTLLVAAMICTLAISASAIEPFFDDEGDLYANMTVLKGTPVVDGVMDDIYKLSDSANCPASRGNTWGTGMLTDETVDHTCWMLWDENYLYIYGVTIENTPGVVNDDFDMWCHDGVEFGFEAKNGEFEGEIFLRLRAAGTVKAENQSLNFFAAEDIKYVANVTEDGHTFEIAIPMPNLEAGMVYVCGCIQAIDIYDSLALDIVTKRAMPDDAWLAANYTGDDSTPDYDDIYITLSAEEVKGEAEETQADTTAKEDEKVDETVDAPQTFDAGIIAAVVAIVSAAGYAISKKR